MSESATTDVGWLLLGLALGMAYPLARCYRRCWKDCYGSQARVGR